MRYAVPTADRILSWALAVANDWRWLAIAWRPQFLRTDTWTEYACAAPVGLLPCPTLAVVMGITLTFDGVRSTKWLLLLSGAGTLYVLSSKPPELQHGPRRVRTIPHRCDRVRRLPRPDRRFRR